MSRTDRLTHYAASHYLTRLGDQLGQGGVEMAKRLHPHLKRIYRQIDYASISGSLTVFIQPEISDIPSTRGMLMRDFSDLAAINTGTMTIQLLGDDDAMVWHEEVGPEELLDAPLAYTYDAKSGERFWVEGEIAGEPYVRGYPLFGLPVFHSLDEALSRYGAHVARHSQCGVLIGAWREAGRVMWKAAPETDLRRSLFFYLRNTLQDGTPDVQEEAPADDKNPVDLTIRWADSNRIALIEVKWLGKSGTLNPPHVTKTWPASRAVSGLHQIADYVDLTRARAAEFDRRGYLVIFDGRRAKVKAEMPICSREDGLHYLNDEISYPQEMLNRHDIANPIRFFCEPSWVVTPPSKKTA